MFEASPQRALNPSKGLAEDMRIDLRGAYVRMAQKRLDRANVTAAPKQLGGKVWRNVWQLAGLVTEDFRTAARTAF